jgi:hypothetical protein
MSGDPIQLMCAFCGNDTDDDPRYVALRLTFPDAEVLFQDLGAHWACLNAAISPSVRTSLHDPFQHPSA